jgi:hypothetical protein
MKKFILSLFVLTAFVLISVHQAQAGLINYNRRNNTGAPTGGGYKKPAATTAKATTTAPMWMRRAPEAKTATEKVYDINRDGLLQPSEVKIYLRSVAEVVDAKGGFTVNSDILKEYDKNHDGLISRIEIQDLKSEANG